MGEHLRHYRVAVRVDRWNHRHRRFRSSRGVRL